MMKSRSSVARGRPQAGKSADDHVFQPEFDECVHNLDEAALKNGRGVVAVGQDEFSWLA